MAKTTYWLKHLLLLIAAFITPVIVYDMMYKREAFDWLYIGAPVPFFLAAYWVLKIKNTRTKIILLHILVSFFITALAIITQPFLDTDKTSPLSEIVFTLALCIHLLVLVAISITQLLNKNKYGFITYLISTIITLLLSFMLFFLWVLNTALGSMKGAITG